MKQIALLLVVALLLAGCGKGGQSAAVVTNSAQPAAAPDFTLKTLDGAEVTLSDLQGQWVLVNFWATWCGPCVAEMQYLENLHQTRAIQILGINYNEAPADVQKFITEHSVTFPILLDPDDALKTAYEARALPLTVVIAPDGTVVNRTLGQIRPETFDAWLDEAGVPRRE